MSSDEEGPIIVKPEALEDAHVPDELFGRKEQIQTIMSYLFPSFTRGKPPNFWLHGPSGAGKTVCAKAVLNKCRWRHGVQGAHINCWEFNSVFAVVDALIDRLRILRAEQQRTTLKLDKLRKHLGHKPFLVVLDELDRASPKERNSIIYNLRQLGRVGLLCISEKKENFFHLDSHVRSRLNPIPIHFGPYSPDELVLILKERAEEALARGTWNVITLQRIAAVTEGDARKAIQILKSAAEFAEVERASHIHLRHIMPGWKNADHLKRKVALENLTSHHRMLYSIIEAHGEIVSGELREEYVKECARKQVKPVAPRTFSDYANDLRTAGLVEIDRARVKGKVRLFRLGGAGRR